MRDPPESFCSGVNIDLDLRAIAANRNPDRARSDSHFPVLEPKADLAGGARRHLPVAGVQLPLVESGDGGDAVIGHEDNVARVTPPAHVHTLSPELSPWVHGEIQGQAGGSKEIDGDLRLRVANRNVDRAERRCDLVALERDPGRWDAQR